MVGTFVTITGTLFGAVQGASTVALNTISAAVVSWSNTSIVAVVPAGASSGPFSVTVNGQVAVSPSFTVTSLPTGWTDTDVGNVGHAGSATYSSGSGTFTVAGAGEGMIGGSADAMNFVYQTLAGDGSIVARVTSMQGGETGVMIRETLNPSATDAFACFSSGYGAFLEYRPTTGASGQSQINDWGTPFPYWMQLVRAGTTFTAFTSPDGVNWTQLGASATITMAQTVYIGLGVTGYGVLSTATFDSVSVNSTAAPAPLITGLSAETAFVGSQVTITGNNFGASQDGSVVFLNDTPMTINLWSNTSIVFAVPVGATSGPVVVSVAPSMNDSNPVTLEIVTQTLPIPWLDLDIGNVGQTGSATYSGGTFTVTGYGSGFGVGGGPDAMHFVFQTLVGNGSIVAQLTSLPNSWPEIGIMIRETLNSNAAGAFVWYWPNQVILQARSATGGSVTSQGASSTGAPIGANYYPYWLKLVRAGTTFTSFISADGVNWVQGASTTISMAQTAYIGMASSNGQVATFGNATITVGTTPLISSLMPTVGTIGTPVTITGSNFGTTQGASSVQFSGVPATSITSWSNSQIVVTVPVTTLNATIPVVVTVNSISSPITPNTLFTLFNPIITSISPTAGPPNGTITINGSGFLFGPGGASYSGYSDSVLINGVSATVAGCTNGWACWSDTQIQVGINGTTPLGPGSVTVNNQGYFSNAFPFTVTNPPAITSLTPTTGVVGTPVTITGTGFGPSQSNSTVTFGGADAGTATSWSDSGAPGGAQIVINVPQNAITGPVIVTIAGITLQGPTFTLDTVATLTASNGAQTTYISTQVGGTWSMYNSQGPGCSSCSVRGNVQNTFDPLGNLLTSIDANGNTVTYTYDGNYNMASKTAQLNGQSVTTSYTYNSFGEVLTMTDPLGDTTTFTYDAKGNLLTVSLPPPNGQTPPSVMQFTYNTLGELTQNPRSAEPPNNHDVRRSGPDRHHHRCPKQHHYLRLRRPRQPHQRDRSDQR